MTPLERFSLKGRLSPIQIGLSAGIGILAAAVGSLIIVLLFNIFTTNSAFQTGYIITDLNDIQRATLLFRNENTRLVSAQLADFEAVELERDLLKGQLRLALTESADNRDIVTSLTAMQVALAEYDAKLDILKENPTPEQFTVVGPELSNILDRLEQESKAINTLEETQFFNTIGNALQTQRLIQVLALVLTGLLLVLITMLVLSIRRTVSHEFEEAYSRLEEEIGERKQAEAELRQSHRELSTANNSLALLNNRLQDELALAHNIQRSILPPPRPTLPAIDIACYSAPARELGGDFYAYHAHDDQHFSLAVGDVSGKGLSAALLMATSVAHFDTVLTSTLSPDKSLAQLSRTLFRYTETTRQNCALCYIVVNGLTLQVANAGGVPPYIRRANGTVESLDVGGLPLGVGLSFQAEYQALTVSLNPGDLVILTSDGVAEAHVSSKNLFGFERLEGALASGPTSSAQAMLEHLKGEIDTFIGNADPPDDLTIVVFQMKARNGSRYLA